MATVTEYTTKDGSKTYKVVIRLKGYPTQTATFKRRTDARHWAQTTEAAILEGRHFKTSEAKKRTFADMIDRYVESVVPARHSKPIANSAIKRHLNWWKERLGAYLLVDVDASMIGALRDELLTTAITDSYGRPILDETEKPKKLKSPATVVRYLASLSVVYSTAINEWGWIEKNPVQKVRRPTEPRGRVRFLSDKEREALLASCEKIGDGSLYVLVILALATGARCGELLSLRWSQVDFAMSAIRLEETKNKERRSLPLVGYANDLLKLRYEKRQRGTELVFPRPDGRKPMALRRPWLRALKEAKVGDFRFHDLRHSAASYLAMNGATSSEIAEVLGHKTLQMVKRYAHLSDQHTSKVVERMNKQIFGKK